MRKYQKIISMIVLTFLIMASMFPILEIRAMEKHKAEDNQEIQDMIIEVEDTEKEEEIHEDIDKKDDLEYIFNKDKEDTTREEDNKVDQKTNIEDKEGQDLLIIDDTDPEIVEKEIKLITMLDDVESQEKELTTTVVEDMPILVDQDYTLKFFLRDYFRKNHIGDLTENRLKYELDKITVEIQDKDDLSNNITKTIDLDDKLIEQLPEIIEEVDLGLQDEKEYMLKPYEIENIKLYYKATEKLIDIRLYYKIFDKYHKTSQTNSDNLRVVSSSMNGQEYLPLDVNSIDIETKIRPNEVVIIGENGEEIIFNKIISMPYNYSNFNDLKGNEENIINETYNLTDKFELELEATPKVIQSLGTLVFKNKSNNTTISKAISIKDAGLVVDNKDVSEYIEYEFLNRVDNLDPSTNTKFYNQDQIKYKIVDLEGLIKTLLGEDYSVRGNNSGDNLEFKVEQGDVINLDFDYKKDKYMLDCIIKCDT